MRRRSQPVLPGHQTGMVLILIVFVVALVSIVAAGLANRQSLDIRRAMNITEQNQARSYAIGGEFFARNLLVRDWKEDKAGNAFVDHEEDAADEPWGMNAVQLPIDLNTGIEGQLDDLMGRFNLNALVVNQGDTSTLNRAHLERFRRLLQNLPDIQVPPELTVESFVDWIDADQESTEFRGAEDDVYLIREEPYRTAGTYFNDISELNLIEGMTREVYDALLPFVVMLPPDVSQLNVNTATAETLLAYIPGLTRPGAEQIISERTEKKGFAKLEDFLQLQPLAGLENIPNSELRVNSNYFIATIRAIVDGRSYRLESTLYRDSSGKTVVMRRDFGKKSEVTKPIVVVN